MASLSKREKTSSYRVVDNVVDMKAPVGRREWNSIAYPVVMMVSTQMSDAMFSQARRQEARQLG